MASIPPPLDVLRELVNTWYGHLAGGGDEHLQTPADLARWCRDHAVAVADDDVTGRDLDLAHTVREGLRAALARHNDAGQPVDLAALGRLEKAAAELPLRVSLAAGEPVLRPHGVSAVPALFAGLLAASVPAARDGTWERLKVCRDPRCRAAFYDTSRNNSGVWCSMNACGAAAKQRAFVERRRAKNAARRAAAGAPAVEPG